MEQKLFKNTTEAPLAERMRPSSLEEFVGQRQLVGEKGPLRNGPLHSCLFWGPPGCGKTTLAKLLTRREGLPLESLSPVGAGVRELRASVKRAQIQLDEQGVKTVMFVDEAHRFNKAQQDYFLPHVESGLLTFIGATTENPSFEINASLLSRLTVYRLSPLEVSEMRILLERTMHTCSGEISAGAADMLLQEADGDARRLLNMVEQLLTTSNVIDEGMIKSLALARLRRFDKRGDDFYDQISAMIKSMRGSDPDAALYWLCRMLDGGTDPLYLSRRVIRLATEDIGLADPNALQVALNGNEQYRQLGSPEGELGVAMAVVYMACAPKSNAIYRAYSQMMQVVRKGNSAPVPLHLRNAPTQLLETQGHGKEYRYAHDEPHGYVSGENYLPKGMESLRVYKPTERGFEERVGKRLAFLRNLDKQQGQ